MTIQEDLRGSGSPTPVQEGEKPARRRYRLHPLHEAAMRIADLGRGRSRTRDLVALLLCHGARAWRSSQPATNVRLRVAGPDERPAIRISIGTKRA